MNVYPSILTDEIELAEEQVEICRESSLVQAVQFDIIDSFFADNITVFPGDLSTVDFGEIKVDFHLMTQEPMDFVHEIKDSKEFLPVRAILGQIEQMTSQVDFLEEIRKNEWLAGLSLNLHTPLESIEDEAWQYIDVIQIMGIKAGFQGQEFNVSSLELISKLNDKIEEDGLDIEIIVDGGVKLKNVKEIEDYGADGVAVGSALWNSNNFEEIYNDFLN